MERAAQLVEPGTGSFAQRVAAVPADVLERAELAVVAAHDDHRDPAGAVLEPVARFGDVVDGARDLPHARPQPLVLERRRTHAETYRSFGISVDEPRASQASESSSASGFGRQVPKEWSNVSMCDATLWTVACSPVTATRKASRPIASSSTAVIAVTVAVRGHVEQQRELAEAVAHGPHRDPFAAAVDGDLARTDRRRTRRPVRLRAR